jgi:8-oxo-dGTP diphosphatase
MKINMTNALILNKDNHVLIIHNIKNDSDRWEFPEGKIEPQETPEEAVIRELEEEIGCEIKIRGIFGDYQTHTPEGDFLCRTYFAEIIRGEPRILEKTKADRLEYATYDKLIELKEEGTLVPNLISALSELKKYMS